LAPPLQPLEQLETVDLLVAVRRKNHLRHHGRRLGKNFLPRETLHQVRDWLELTNTFAPRER
jgi:hypothetical protein